MGAPTTNEYITQVDALSTALISAISTIGAISYNQPYLTMTTGSTTPPQATPVTFTAPATPVVTVVPPAFPSTAAPEQPTGWATVPSPPTLPTPVTITQPTNPAFPTNMLQAPTINMPTIPVAPTYTVPVAPSLGVVARPSDLVLEVIAAPTLQDVNIPSAPVIEMPVWDAIAPIAPSLNIPTGILDNFTPPKDRIWLSGDWIDTALDESETGIPPEIEAEIWNREEERARLALIEAQRNLRQTFAKRGFSLPTGKLNTALLKLEQEYVLSRATSSREISFKQAELAQANRQFRITSGIEWEKAHMNFTENYGALLLSVAKETVNVAVQIANMYIEEYKAALQGYTVEAQVFGELVKAQLAKTEVYRSQLDGAKIEKDLQLADVEIYKAMIAANESIVQAYQAQIQAYTADLGAQKMQVDIYSAQIDALVSGVKIYEAQVGATVAAAKIEESKLQVFVAQADAFAKNIEAISAQVDANAAFVQSQGMAAAAQAEASKVMIAYYQALTESGKMQNDTILKAYEAQIQSFVATLEVALKQADAGVEAQKAITAANLSVYNGQIELEKARGTAVIQENQISLEAFQSSVDAGIKNRELIIKTADFAAVNAKNNADTEIAKWAKIGDLLKQAMSSYANISIGRAS